MVRESLSQGGFQSESFWMLAGYMSPPSSFWLLLNSHSYFSVAAQPLFVIGTSNCETAHASYHPAWSRQAVSISDSLTALETVDPTKLSFHHAKGLHISEGNLEVT